MPTSAIIAIVLGVLQSLAVCGLAVAFRGVFDVTISRPSFFKALTVLVVSSATGLIAFVYLRMSPHSPVMVYLKIIAVAGLLLGFSALAAIAMMAYVHRSDSLRK